jgi:hypothetical protein
LSLAAENDGCQRIALAEEQHDRTAMSSKIFWDQLANAIYEATPAAQVNWLALMPTPSHPQPSQTAQITSTSTAPL